MESLGIKEIIESNEAYRNIITRRSVRRFDGTPVTEEQKEAICYAAMCAPSGVNRQPWEFVIADDKELLTKLAEALPYAKMATEAPLAIVVCGNRDRFLEGIDAALWEQDLSAASENILLAANALGLGGVWTCLYPHADREDTVRKLLNLPANFIPFNLIPIGHPSDNHAPMDKWHTDRIHHNRM